MRAPRQEAGSEWVRLDDGRWLCLACVGTVVMDSRDAAPLYRNVLAFYTRMGMPFPETVRISAAPRPLSQRNLLSLLS